MALHELDKAEVQADVETYLEVALVPINPSESDITSLVRRAGILFIYAATVVRYVGRENFGNDPRSRFDTALGVSTPVRTGVYDKIDKLYTVVLKSAFDDPNSEAASREDMRRVLNVVICAQELLTISTLSVLLGLQDEGRVQLALRPLWSVLHVDNLSTLVTALYASFLDHIFDSRRSGQYHCDPVRSNQTFVLYCFDYIKRTNPQFNICGLESSFLPDRSVHDLKNRINKAISQGLFYACRYWTTHLGYASGAHVIYSGLEDFLSARLLLWMEILNLKQCMHLRARFLQQAEVWARVSVVTV